MLPIPSRRRISPAHRGWNENARVTQYSGHGGTQSSRAFARVSTAPTPRRGPRRVIMSHALHPPLVEASDRQDSQTTPHPNNASLNFSQCVEGRRWGPWARAGIEAARVVAGTEPCHGEELHRAAARFYARQSVRN